MADPTQAVLGDQNSGLFTFDFDLDFSGAGGSFAAGTSDFSITKLQNDNGSGSNSFNNPDNVDWTDATTLNGTTLLQRAVSISVTLCRVTFDRYPRGQNGVVIVP